MQDALNLINIAAEQERGTLLNSFTFRMHTTSSTITADAFTL
jgi:hypothetical protein